MHGLETMRKLNAAAAQHATPHPIDSSARWLRVQGWGSGVLTTSAVVAALLAVNYATEGIGLHPALACAACFVAGAVAGFLYADGRNGVAS